MGGTLAVLRHTGPISYFIRGKRDKADSKNWRSSPRISTPGHNFLMGTLITLNQTELADYFGPGSRKLRRSRSHESAVGPR